MTVKIRPYKRGGWEVDIRVAQPDGSMIRERRRAPVSSRTAALRWGRARERELLLSPEPTPRLEERKEAPTLAEFAPRFLEGYARANRQKPSGIAAKETILRVHLIPALGLKRLDEITAEDIQRLKSRLSARSAKTVNNILTVLNTLLRVATEWDVIESVPCAIRLLRTPPTVATFHDFDEFERLVASAGRIGWATHLAVLLGGEAGLRCGEMMALEWSDIDLAKRQVWIRRSEWKGQVTSPKGGRPRCVPLTARLTEALRAARHLRSSRVLCREDGRSLTQKVLRERIRKASRKCFLRNEGTHTLRHTFCSHLAMRGAPVRAIQELAGHKNLSTSQRYMHLSPAAIDSAIRLLEQPSPVPTSGDILETGKGGSDKVNV